jgi:hypothetical protein
MLDMSSLDITGHSVEASSFAMRLHLEALTINKQTLIISFTLSLIQMYLLMTAGNG